MYLFAVHSDDVSALWLYRRLQESGCRELELVTIEQLLYNRHLVFQLQGGKASFSIELHDGRLVRSENVCGFINRVRYLPVGVQHPFKEEDREYVATELQAIFTYWGSTFDNNLFNRVTTGGFNGRNRSLEEWIMLAASAGLTTLPFYRNTFGSFSETSHLHEEMTLIVWQGKCFSQIALPPIVEDQCVRLLQLSGENLIGVKLSRSKDDFVFVNATVHPDLRTGGQTFVEKLLKILENGSSMRHTG